MADVSVIETLKIGGKSFCVKPCWEQLGLNKSYMLALLSRDEYTPVATHQPSATDVLYTDPVSGNTAGVHPGQCIIYPDSSIKDGWGLSIAKQVELNADGAPVRAYWYHATDVEKRVQDMELNLTKRFYGCFGTGVWINDYPWQTDAIWDNGE